MAANEPCGTNTNDFCTDPDTCDGSGTCEPNDEPNGTDCDDGAFCNGNDTCSAGACTVHAGDPCIGADGDENCTESCNEVDNNCLGNDPNGATCNNGDGCTTGETCSAGICQGGDSSGCGDLCGDEPETVGCVLASKYQIGIKDFGDATLNSLKWKWKKGLPVNPSALGSPTTTTTYALCVYDRTSGTPVKVASYRLPPNSLWRVDGNKIKYRDKTGAEDGFQQVKGRASLESGKSYMSVKLGGTNFAVPPTFSNAEYFDVDPSMTVQLITNEGACWTSDFLLGQVKKNTPFQFLAKGP